MRKNKCKNDGADAYNCGFNLTQFDQIRVFACKPSSSVKLFWHMSQMYWQFNKHKPEVFFVRDPRPKKRQQLHCIGDISVNLADDYNKFKPFFMHNKINGRWKWKRTTLKKVKDVFTRNVVQEKYERSLVCSWSLFSISEFVILG